MTSLEERYALQFIHTLQVEDLLNKEVEERNSSWKPSKALAVRYALSRSFLC
jgi:hypothetical protein